MRDLVSMFTVCVLLVAASAAHAGTVLITTEDGDGADATVQSNAGNTNYGSSTGVNIKRDTGLSGFNRKIYLRFDLGALTDPILDATLSLTYRDRSPDSAPNPTHYYVYGLGDGHTGESWGEYTTTWNNAPGNNTGSTWAVLPSATSFLGEMALDVNVTSPGDTISFTSGALATFLAGDTDGQATFILTRKEASFRVELYASREHLTLAPPTLSITTGTQVVPTPAALPAVLALMLLGLAGSGLRRLRRIAR